MWQSHIGEVAQPEGVKKQDRRQEKFRIYYSLSLLIPLLRSVALGISPIVSLCNTKEKCRYLFFSPTCQISQIKKQSTAGGVLINKNS